MSSISDVLTPTNLAFLFRGLGLTLYLSAIIICLSSIFGTVLALMRNSKNKLVSFLASVLIEFIRNVPNLLWIFTVFLVFQLKSRPAGITAFTIFTSAALAEIIRGGFNAIDKGQTEAGLAQGFSQLQILRYIILPQAIRKMLPAMISQAVTVIKDTSLLYSVIALQELFGASQIIMGRNVEPGPVFTLYVTLALLYFVVNFSISQLSRHLSKHWELARD